MEMHRTPKIAEEWARAIGMIVTVFSDIESLVYVVYDCLPPDSLAKHGVQIKDFRDRARFLQALLRASDWPEAKDIEQQIERCIPLATFRNRIAHNPMMIEIYENTNSSELAFGVRMMDSKRRHDFTDMDLIMLNGKLREISDIGAQLRDFVIAVSKRTKA